jgi:hypothetical protein
MDGRKLNAGPSGHASWLSADSFYLYCYESLAEHLAETDDTPKVRGEMIAPTLGFQHGHGPGARRSGGPEVPLHPPLALSRQGCMKWFMYIKSQNFGTPDHIAPGP